MPSIQRVDKVDTLSQMPKNADIFCKIVFVGVRWYSRERFCKKQATARKLDVFLAVLMLFYADSRNRLSL